MLIHGSLFLSLFILSFSLKSFTNFSSSFIVERTCDISFELELFSSLENQLHSIYFSTTHTIFKHHFIKRETILFGVNCIQRLNRDLHYLATSLHHFVNFPTGVFDNSAPSPWNPKAFDTFNFIFVVKSITSNLNSLSNVCADRVLCVNNRPRVALKDENRS